MSKYPLKWIATEAMKAQLLIDPQRLDEVLGIPPSPYAPASPDAKVHYRMQPWWWALTEFMPKKHWNFDKQAWEWRANLFRRRTLPPKPIVHDVAWQIPGYVVPKNAVPLSEAFP